jgi:hypothetical protein
MFGALFLKQESGMPDDDDEVYILINIIGPLIPTPKFVVDAGLRLQQRHDTAPFK